MVNVTVAESADCVYTCHRPSSLQAQDHAKALQRQTDTQDESEHTNTSCDLFPFTLSFFTVSHLSLTLESETIPPESPILLHHQHHHHLFLPWLTVYTRTQIWSKHTDTVAAPVTLYWAPNIHTCYCASWRCVLVEDEMCTSGLVWQF